MHTFPFAVCLGNPINQSKSSSYYVCILKLLWKKVEFKMWQYILLLYFFVFGITLSPEPCLLFIAYCCRVWMVHIFDMTFFSENLKLVMVNNIHLYTLWDYTHIYIYPWKNYPLWIYSKDKMISWLRGLYLCMCAA